MEIYLTWNIVLVSRPSFMMFFKIRCSHTNFTTEPGKEMEVGNNFPGAFRREWSSEERPGGLMQPMWTHHWVRRLQEPPKMSCLRPLPRSCVRCVWSELHTVVNEVSNNFFWGKGPFKRKSVWLWENPHWTRLSPATTVQAGQITVTELPLGFGEFNHTHCPPTSLPPRLSSLASDISGPALVFYLLHTASWGEQLWCSNEL